MNESLVLALRDEILNRIRGEYLEMPGLCLTHARHSGCGASTPKPVPRRWRC